MGMRENLLHRHDLLFKLQSRGYTVEPFQNKHTKTFSQNLISVNELMCYIIPVWNGPMMMSSAVLDNTDFLIGSIPKGNITDYFIIPTEMVDTSPECASLPIQDYLNAWNFLEL